MSAHGSPRLGATVDGDVVEQVQPTDTGAGTTGLATQTPALTSALVAVETSERLASRAATLLDEIPEGDLAMAPLSVVAAVEEATLLLAKSVGITSSTTCTLVKDMRWSDTISQRARVKVSVVLARVREVVGGEGS